MCTGIVETAKISGSKGPNGWFNLEGVSVSYDHPFHNPLEHALNIDFVDETGGLANSVAVELTPESAKKLAQTIIETLARGGVDAVLLSIGKQSSAP
jgi:Family of unknown function (DUF6295)